MEHAEDTEETKLDIFICILVVTPPNGKKFQLADWLVLPCFSSVSSASSAVKFVFS